MGSGYLRALRSDDSEDDEELLRLAASTALDSQQQRSVLGGASTVQHDGGAPSQPDFEAEAAEILQADEGGRVGWEVGGALQLWMRNSYPCPAASCNRQ
jgi:hypothetical protein